MGVMNGPHDPFDSIYGSASDLNGDGHTELWEAATYSDILEESGNDGDGIDDAGDFDDNSDNEPSDD